MKVCAKRGEPDPGILGIPPISFKFKKSFTFREKKGRVKERARNEKSAVVKETST